MRPYSRMLMLATLLLVPAPALLAQTAVGPSGHWEGMVQAPNMEVRIEIDLAKNSNGELAGTFSSPTQKLTGLRLSNVATAGTSLSFQIAGALGERTFDVAFSADGTSMSGNYTQGGYAMPISLTRMGDARMAQALKSPPIGRELEGTWNGTLDVNGMQRRIVLTMSNQPDGAAAGSFVNVDEGLEIPIATITQKPSSLTLDVKAIGGSYSAVLNTEGTELVGTWTQGAMGLPLTFRRAKP